MLRKLNLERMTTVAAAVAAGLLMPAPAQAQSNEVCIQYYRDYCATVWQRQGFASSAQCADWYKENACRGTTIYEEYHSPVSSADRRD